MSSCQRFVQNAWKKELCSNCFKSKEEHVPAVDNRIRYLAALKSQSFKPPPLSILKGVKNKKLESRKVSFPADESEIIGFGGEDYSDDENEEDCLQENGGPEEDVVDGEEDKELQRLTKSNTDFNSNPVNLIENECTSEIKKPAYTPLMLGKPVKDADGKKQTLFVSVQPFGAGSQPSPVAINRKTHLRSLLHDSPDLNNIREVNFVPVDKSTPTMYKVTDVQDMKTANLLSCSNVIKSESDNPVELPLLNGNENNIGKPSKEEQFVLKESNGKTETLEKVETEIIKTDSHLTANMEEKSQLTKTSAVTKPYGQMKIPYSQFGTESVKFESENILNNKNANILSDQKNVPENRSVSENRSWSCEEKNVIEQKNIKNISNSVCANRVTSKTNLYTKSNELLSRKNLSKLSTVNCACNDCLISHGDVESEQSKNILCLLETSNIQVRSQYSETLASQVPVTLESQDKDVSFHVMKILDSLPESREMAGEPDGRADSDDLDEPPDLPSSPVPTPTCEPHPQPSFLHNLTKDKPKIPLKPKLVDSSSATEEQEKYEQSKEVRTPSPTISGSPSSTELNGKSTKRQAPKPPPLPNCDGPGVFLRNSGNQSNVDSPVVRERVKRVQRERAASCSPLPSDSSSNGSGHQTPEPSSPRQSVSVSHEILSHEKNTAVVDKKRGNKMRSTIRKFLRLGSRDDHLSDELLSPPLPPVRPRPEIIHPLDLNKSGVQVVRGNGSHVLSERASLYSPSSPPAVLSSTGRPSKPPPPPRSQSLDLILDTRPARPPPPKVELTTNQRQTHTLAKADSVYANIGEARSSIAPVKPQRTASIRDSVYKEGGAQDTELQGVNDNDNVYEYLAPECDLSRERSSLPYCGSETESDIYYPYTFGNSQEGVEDDPEPSAGGKTRLHVQKGCSVIHKSLEENYSAIVAANYEALTQLLEQVQQMPLIPPSLRMLKTATSLQWSDFDVSEDSNSVLFGGRVFLNAHWNQVPVTLCLTLGQSRIPNMMSPLTQFFDLIASKYLNSEKTELVQVSVAVLVRQQVFSLQLYCSVLKNNVETARESVLIMVQVINNLKSLQARGIEDTHLTQFIVSREDTDFNPKVYHLPHEKEKKNAEGMSLCQCAITAVDMLPLPESLCSLLHTLLIQERATSLSQAKAVLELWLWGPTHVSVTSDIQECLQRWLDLERATLLHSLAINHQSRMNISEYCRLAFLIGTNAKIMAEALTHLDSLNAQAAAC